MKLAMKFNLPWVVVFDHANSDAWKIKDKNGQTVMERESYTGDGDQIHLCVAEAVEMVELINRFAGRDEAHRNETPGIAEKRPTNAETNPS